MPVAVADEEEQREASCNLARSGLLSNSTFEKSDPYQCMGENRESITI
jgi:hypothetical protein